ncbi:ABC transporter permease [Alloacidobacterium dinghuense]|uniref:ABC transporter permease n=1 Tax=Alloacidobacterium dinghuense TaxID=2763107 RepID=A0A7G8BMZ0_9BACT|nr:ABC transporter permease [Alloacidobacterium dinghuense]QNI33910.1 ABC transporter permease [Alloacidobacterium dinghuense]
MESFGRFFRKLWLFARREKFHRDLEEEMSFHRDQVEEEFRSRGMGLEAARHAARRGLGNDLRLREQSHESVAFWFERFFSDCRYAVRQFLKAPGFALAVVLTLALGIGATTTIFTLVYATLLRNLPYPEADRILHIADMRLQGQSTAGLVAVPRFFDLRARSRSFAAVSFFYFDHPTMVAEGQLPMAMKAVGTDGQFWNVLGVQPLLGRTFNDQDDQPNVPDAIVLSYPFWQQHFGGDPGVIGRQVSLDQKTATVVGVMPASFHLPNGIELWRPAHFDPADWGKYRGEGTRFINVFARLRPGVSMQLAQNDLQRIDEQLAHEHPDTDGVWQFHGETLRDDMYGELRPALLVLLIASGFLLLIACMNVANLLLSRATAREREVVLRRALGASEWRLRLQFLTESTLLSLAGGCIGLVSTYALVRTAGTRLPGRLGTPGTIAMNWPIVWFAVALSVVTGIAFGLAPALKRVYGDLSTGLKRNESRLAGAAGNGVRSAFIAVQVGLSLVLLVGACLLAESLWRLVKSPLGFEPDHLLTFAINLPWDSKQDVVRNFYANVQQRIESLPGVAAVGQIDALPTVDWHLRSNFDADWLPRIANKPAISAEDRHIAGSYLGAMGTPLLAGRALTASDAEAKVTPIMINQQLVRQYLPNGNPIGRHLMIGKDAFEIVGVMSDVRGTAGSIAKTVGPEVYFPADGDHGVVVRSFVVRSHVPPEQLIKAIREQVHQVDAQQAIANVSTMDSLLDKAVAQPRLNMAMVALFAVIALALACVGIYGVVAYSVAQRTQEIGVRMALGATRGKILRHFMRHVLHSALVGLLGGIVCAFLLTRLLRSQLYGVEPNNLLVYLGSVALLLIPVVLATLRPALAAASVNPVEALRNE